MKRTILIFALCLQLVFCCMFFGCSARNAQPTQANGYTDIDKKIVRINEIKQVDKICKEFIFITDLHWDRNTKKSPELVKKISAGTGIENIVFGGDYIEKGYNNKKEALSIMQDCISAFNTDDYVAILGNHDMNTTSNPEAEEISESECISILNNNKFDKDYFFIEDKANKICDIYLNTNTFKKDSVQYKWLQEKLTTFDSDCTVLIFMHEYNEFARAGICIKKGAKGLLLDQLLMDNKNKIKCSIAGIFSGHTHRDYFDYNNFGCPIISTTSDAIGVYAWCDNLYKREKGTITEQAFDVVQVDIEHRTVFMTRVGAGVDRTYYY